MNEWSALLLSAVYILVLKLQEEKAFTQIFLKKNMCNVGISIQMQNQRHSKWHSNVGKVKICHVFADLDKQILQVIHISHNFNHFHKHKLPHITHNFIHLHKHNFQ